MLRGSVQLAALALARHPPLRRARRPKPSRGGRQIQRGERPTWLRHHRSHQHQGRGKVYKQIEIYFFQIPFKIFTGWPIRSATIFCWLLFWSSNMLLAYMPCPFCLPKQTNADSVTTKLKSTKCSRRPDGSPCIYVAKWKRRLKTYHSRSQWPQREERALLAHQRGILQVWLRRRRLRQQRLLQHVGNCHDEGLRYRDRRFQR